MRAGAFLAGLLLTALAISPALAARVAGLPDGEHWFAATLNHRHADFTVLVYQPPTGEPWLRVLDLDQLGIPYATERTLRHRAEDYVLPAALNRHEVHLDPAMRRAHFVTRVRPHTPENTPADLLLDVRINGVLIDQPVYVRNTGSDLVLPRETLEQLRIELPEAYGPFIEDGLPVHALAGETFHYAMDRLYLEMTIPADLFVTTRLAPDRSRRGTMSDWLPSAVLAYNLAGGEDAAGNRWHSGIGDLALSAGTVSCRSRHLAQSQQDEVLRLDSACIADWPELPLSAGIGDHYSMPGALQETVAYGGFWIGTDYGLQPYRNLQPSLIVDGNARLPSTLEIWMDQQLGFRQEIPPGPFVIDNLPAVSGSGELRAVLVNALGQQVLVSAPVYSDPRLLQPGIVDWRVETGRLRPGGFTDDLYTDRFTAATGRIGVTDWFTTELHAERSEELSLWSGTAAVRMWRFGLLEAGISQSEPEGGGKAAHGRLLGYSWRGNHLHAAFREIRRDPGYLGLGYPEPGDAPERERLASVSVSLGPARLTLTGVERRFSDETAETRLGNAALAIRLGTVGQLLFSATRDFSESGDEPVYMAHLSIPIGRRGHAWHSVSRSDATDGASTGYNHSPPAGSGAGFRASRDRFGNSERYFAEATLRGDKAVATASVQDFSGGDASWGARLAGAVVASRAGIGLARDDGDSFAVVRTAPGVEDVTVRREHQAAASTGANGKAVISGLRPYQVNRLALAVDELPLAADVRTDGVTVVPGRRGVVVADFGFRKQRYLLARLVTPAFADVEIPAGSEILVNGAAAGLVGYDGTIYVALPDDNDAATIDVRWSGGHCTVTADITPDIAILEAGELTCLPR